MNLLSVHANWAEWLCSAASSRGSRQNEMKKNQNGKVLFIDGCFFFNFNFYFYFVDIFDNDSMLDGVGNVRQVWRRTNHGLRLCARAYQAIGGVR